MVPKHVCYADCMNIASTECWLTRRLTPRSKSNDSGSNDHVIRHIRRWVSMPMPYHLTSSINIKTLVHEGYGGCFLFSRAASAVPTLSRTTRNMAPLKLTVPVIADAATHCYDIRSHSLAFGNCNYRKQPGRYL